MTGDRLTTRKFAFAWFAAAAVLAEFVLEAFLSEAILEKGTKLAATHYHSGAN